MVNDSDTAKVESSTNETKAGVVWWAVLTFVGAAALLLRWWNVQTPDIVIWDEHHFLRFAQSYLQRSYFIDVHPPLGKLAISGIGWFCDLNTSLPITEGVNLTTTEQPWYICMRRQIGIFGMLCVVLVFLTVWEMSHSLLASIISSMLVMTDSASISYSRLILLDPILTASVLLSFLLHVRFCRTNEKSQFDSLWWCQLLLTGAAIGLTISVKYVGVFIVSLVGITTAADLWRCYCNTNMSLCSLLGRTLRYVVALILLPASVYILIFTLHSIVLHDVSKLEGIGLHSAEFRQTMSRTATSAREVMYGSQVTVLSCLHHAGYLSTSFDTYPPGLGVEQQIVALDPKLDELNYWMFRHHEDKELVSAEDESRYVARPVLHGELVRLYSVVTESHLHTLRVPAAITRQVYQTTSYGEIGEEHPGSVWRVEILSSTAKPGVTGLTAIKSRFRLINNRTGCILSAGSDRYPSWGYNTWEVVCDPAGEKRIDRSGQIWQIDENLNPKLDIGDFSDCEMSPWQRALEMHAVMLQTNSRLTLSSDSGEDSLQRLLSSQAWMWPILYRGCPGHHGPHYSLYFIGSPHVYLINGLALLATPVLIMYSKARAARRRHRTPKSLDCSTGGDRLTNNMIVMMFAWMLHYLPFWTMNRILYFHHYLLPFHFTSMITGLVYYKIEIGLERKLAKNTAGCLRLALFSTSVLFLVKGLLVNWPLTYGVDPRITGNSVSQHFYLRSWKM